MDSDTAGRLFIIIILIALSAVFTMAETAVRSAQKSGLKDLADGGDKRALLALSIIEAPDRMLTAMLIGDTVSNVAAAVLSILFIGELTELHGVGLTLWIIVVTVIILLFGEIVPKKAAEIKAEDYVLKNVKLINFMTVLFTPLVFIVNALGRLFMLILHIKPDSKKAITEEELRDIVDISHEEGVIENEEKFMITNVFDFGDQTARDIMIPRVDMTCVDVNADFDELMREFRRDQYTRMPVYEEDTDNIIGVINVKDLLLQGTEGDVREDFSVRRYMREPFFTFESKKVSRLLNEMRKSSYNLAIVLSEYGSCVGMITMEDMLEEIVGDIRDEYDADEEKELINVRVSDREYLVDGSMRLND
ncbi:MAG TPA: HlyC/CorC family transporter, partial [Candidatus Avilachnospira avistercoris]|nr:HlyC/CorC family transporter [Candidatus Avilachnospira avistercoris]